MPIRQQLLPYEPYRNSALFSSHWLESRLRLEPEWTEYRANAEAAVTQLAALWNRQRNRVERYGTEAPLEEAFIQPVLGILGWSLEYQTFLQGRKPDYALFPSDADYDAALAEDRRAPAFWERVAVVADAKAWDVSLDRPATYDGQREFPPQQIEWYIDRSRRDFGILTNGRLWRLYPRDREPHQPRFETYFEFNMFEFLRELARRQALPPPELVDDFLYFYLLFSPVAFQERPDRKPLVVRALEGSSAYRIGIGEDLRARAFEAVRLATEGFLSFADNGLGSDDVELCRRESFVLVYRLLFIMFAEDRGLLPFGTNRLYTENRSLRRYRDDIATTFDREEDNRAYAKTNHAVLNDLRLLFDLVNTGHARYGVPPYNGGLFDPEAHPFLEQKQISDWHLARAIDQLGRANDPNLSSGDLFRVDYRDLAIQHLGSIYEGLLELEPRTATTRMVVVARRTRERTEERTIPESHPTPEGFERTDVRYEVGQVYLQTSKGERRASGSYYTPDHIVNHIVEKTLGPLCRRVSDQLEADVAHASGADAQRLRTEFDDRLLKLRIVDPAMGSGHFLLRACAYLAEEIATHPMAADEAVQQAGSAAIVFWKRRVAENCLYGVDLNDLAVELAKLAMWLETVAIDQPLTFLSHHLRHGNSLIGAKLDALGALPDAPALYTSLFKAAFEEKLPLLIEPLTEILSLPSIDVRQVKQKEKLLAELDRARQPFRDVADVWASTFVLPENERVIPDDYRELVEEIGRPRRFAALLERFQPALNAAHRPSMQPFNWEIEFPEVYFDERGRREQPGFDAVIGNPPYDVLSEAETGHDLSAIRAVASRDPAYGPSLRGKNNLYKLFVCRGLDLLTDDSYMGFITPMAILGDDQAADIRRAILAAGTFTDVDSFPQKDDPRDRVFPEAKLSTAVVIVHKAVDRAGVPFACRVHPGRNLTETTASVSISREQVPLYDPRNLTVISCDQADYDLAARITGSTRVQRLSEIAEFFQGEVNETVQTRKQTVSRGESDRFKKFVQRGASICLYVLRPPSQGHDLYLDISAFLDGASTLYRSVLRSADFSTHLAGATGVFKSELTALAQQHFGVELDARHLPGSWSSTGNALEGIAFAAKDALLAIDDFAPGGSTGDVQRFHREADRLLRAQGNNSGRQRMRADGSLRPSKPPRGLILSTGEDIPRGQSLRARLCIIEISPGDIHRGRLTECQRDAGAGLYAQALAGYVQWLAANYTAIHGELANMVAKLREQACAGGQHARTPGIVAEVTIGLRLFLRFAVGAGAISAEDELRLKEQGWKASIAAADLQAAHQIASEPAQQFLRLVGAALVSGRAHIAADDGTTPADFPEAWGWRRVTIGAGAGVRDEWQPQGRRIGWVESGHLLLEPDSSFAEAQRLAVDQGESLPVQGRTVWKRLKEKGLLVSFEESRQRLTVRRTVEGSRREVLCLRSALILDSTVPTVPPDSLPAELGLSGRSEVATGAVAVEVDRGMNRFEEGTI